MTPVESYAAGYDLFSAIYDLLFLTVFLTLASLVRFAIARKLKISPR